MRITHPTHHASRILDLSKNPLWPNHHTGKQVIVACQVFGCAVHNEVNADVKRTQVDRCGKGAVHDRDKLSLCGEFDHSSQVENPEVRIGRRFGEGQARVRADGGGDLGRLLGRAEAHLDPPSRQEVEGEVPRAAVAIANHHHVIVLGQ